MYANKIYNTFLKSGDHLEEINKQYLYQLNLNIHNKTEPDRRIIRICDTDTRELIVKNYEIITKNVGKIDKRRYNKDKENAWNIIINSQSYEEMKENLKKIFNSEDTKEFIEEVERMESNEVMLNDWDAEVLNESINRAERVYAKNEGIKLGEKIGEARGIKLGENQKEQSLIENMFKNNIDISLISKVTSVPIKQLQKIKTNLF